MTSCHIFFFNVFFIIACSVWSEYIFTNLLGRKILFELCLNWPWDVFWAAILLQWAKRGSRCWEQAKKRLLKELFWSDNNFFSGIFLPKCKRRLRTSRTGFLPPWSDQESLSYPEWFQPSFFGHINGAIKRMECLKVGFGTRTTNAQFNKIPEILNSPYSSTPQGCIFH